MKIIFRQKSPLIRHKLTAASGYDPDAQAFYDVNTGLSEAIMSAFSAYVEECKDEGIWTQKKQLYPFLGGTQAAHKWNAIDPRDLDAAFRITWTGTAGNHTSAGWNPNGTETGDFHFDASIDSVKSDCHVAWYSQLNTTESNKIDFGNDNGGVRFAMESDYNDTFAWDCYSTSSGTGRVTGSNGGAQGYWMGNRSSDTDSRVFKNGSQIGSTATGSVASQSPPTGACWLGGRDNSYKTLQTYGIWSIGLSYSVAEALADYNAVQTLMEALGRDY